MLSQAAVAQSDDDYKVHTIKHGEIISVLAKKYNVTVEEIIRLNKFGPNPVLHVGQKVKLPANAVLSETVDSAAQTTLVPPPSAEKQESVKEVPDTAFVTSPPVVHVVQKGEVLSVLAKKYGVTVEEIIKLNKFSANHIVHVGDKVKLPAAAATQVPAQQEVPPPPPPQGIVEKPVQKMQDTSAQPAGNATIHLVKSKETLYSIGKQYKVTVDQIKSWNNLKDNKIGDGQKLVIHTTAASPAGQPVVKTDTIPKQAVAVAQPQQKIAAPPVVTSSPAAKLPAGVKKETPTAITQKPAPQAADASIPASGYFSSSFGKDVTGRSLKTTNGEAMTFKTASGWTDKKYYILMNDVPPGSIVQVTNAEGKAIYAKILWNMGDIKDNEGLNFRISDAAAVALGLKDIKFPLTVTFYE